MEVAFGKWSQMLSYCPVFEDWQAKLESHFGLVPDPRVTNWPIMNVTTVIALGLAYLVITHLGMFLMSGRKAYDLYAIRVLHNFAMVALSVYMLYSLVKGHFIELAAVSANPETSSNPAWRPSTAYDFWCTPFSKTDATLPIATAVWVFVISKPIEFIDTFIMVLRKSNRQINFLHMYHHFTIFFVWYINLRYNPGGDGWFASAFNSFVHVVMYSYYFLATLNMPCPWKKYITKLQILQFVSFVLQAIYGLMTPSCSTPRPLLIFNCLYAASLLSLFIRFYITSYSQPRPPAKKTN